MDNPKELFMRWGHQDTWDQKRGTSLFLIHAVQYSCSCTARTACWHSCLTVCHCGSCRHVKHVSLDPQKRSWLCTMVMKATWWMLVVDFPPNYRKTPLKCTMEHELRNFLQTNGAWAAFFRATIQPVSGQYGVCSAHLLMSESQQLRALSTAV